MRLPKIHKLVGSSSQEEKSVQGLGRFCKQLCLFTKERQSSVLHSKSQVTGEGFSVPNFPCCFGQASHPKAPSLSGLFPGPHTVLAQTSAFVWSCTHSTLLLLSCLASQPHSPLPKTAPCQSSPSQSLNIREENKRAHGLDRDLCAAWRFWDSHYFAACFPKLIAGAF